ncbi:Uncharacterized protein BTT61001_03721 [Bacillus thuringiensis]|uniref:Uncharacterized protein n=1 Tax=Bacillus thuringiensis TaxID=1428 RepID=A0A1C4F026_BACTU|nr:hypothetical protein [Bacillus wiedmannii]SCC49053.1 Uncharacterized protein BTT61001_03721 [Bacillus thuringiensis]
MTAIAIGYKIMSVKGFSRNYHSPAGGKMKCLQKGEINIFLYIVDS